MHLLRPLYLQHSHCQRRAHSLLLPLPPPLPPPPLSPLEHLPPQQTCHLTVSTTRSFSASPAPRSFVSGLTTVPSLAETPSPASATLLQSADRSLSRLPHPFQVTLLVTSMRSALPLVFGVAPQRQRQRCTPSPPPPPPHHHHHLQLRAHPPRLLPCRHPRVLLNTLLQEVQEEVPTVAIVKVPASALCSGETLQAICAQYALTAMTNGPSSWSELPSSETREGHRWHLEPRHPPPLQRLSPLHEGSEVLQVVRYQHWLLRLVLPSPPHLHHMQHRVWVLQALSSPQDSVA